MPIEETARQILITKLSELKKIRRELKYSKLSLEPITWRNDQGFPIFALFNIILNYFFMCLPAKLVLNSIVERESITLIKIILSGFPLSRE